MTPWTPPAGRVGNHGERVTPQDRGPVGGPTATPWQIEDAEEAQRRERLRSPGALLRAALWYGVQGVAVFPLKPGTKVPATTHGLHDAGPDAGQIRAWWARWPQANIGLPTGHQFDVWDVDPPDGFTSLDVMREAGLVPPPIGYAVTARSGVHIYVPPTGEGNAAGVLPGIDYRGLGGYVVAAPSRNEIGMWTWAQPLEVTP